MQFKVSQLMIVVTCFACVMAIGDLSTFRHSITILFTVVLAWVASSLAISRGSKRAWQWGAIAGVVVGFTWNLIILLTWPTFIGGNFGLAFRIPVEFYAREVAFFLALSAIVGASVGGWVTVTEREALQPDFSIAVLMSKLILLATIVFRLLTLVPGVSVDWGTLALFSTLVFVIHSFNWLSRLFKHLDVPSEIKMRSDCVVPQTADE